MSKQDIIREGIGSRIVDIFCEGIAYAVEKQDGGQAIYTPSKRIKEFIEYLHNSGAVIKKEGIKEVATTASEREMFSAIGKASVCVSTERTADIYKWFKENGYTLTEPLLEEK